MTIHNSFRLATTCSAVAIALSFPTLLAAQTDAWTMLQAQYIEDLNTLESKFVDLAGAFPAEDYAWRSMDSVRSISEEFMLIVAENYVIPSAWEAAAPTGMTISTALFSSSPQTSRPKRTWCDTWNNPSPTIRPQSPPSPPSGFTTRSRSLVESARSTMRSSLSPPTCMSTWGS